MAAAEQGKEKRNRLLINLFGLPFLLVGLGVMIGGPIETLWQHWQSRDWVAVPAALDHLSLESHTGDDSTTWSIDARYRYRYNGHEFHASRVGYDWGSDNIGDYHRRTVSFLRAQQSRGQLLAWVNPAAPGESYLSRELRWKKLLFGGLFGLVFAVAGAAVMLLPRLRSRRRLETGGHVIDSSERRGYWVWAFMSFMFIGISSPALVAIPDEMGKGNWPILAALVFPLAGLWMGWHAWRQRSLWQYYGPMPVSLAPDPGQLGGDVAGTVPVNRYQADASYQFTLQCLKITVSGSGKNRSRSERVLWQDRQYGCPVAVDAGFGLRFLFSPPADLPASGEEGSTSWEWRLLLESPAPERPLNRTWVLPVVPGSLRAEPLPEQHVRENDRRSRLDAAVALADQIDMQWQGGGLQLDSRAGRHRGMTVMLLLMGVIFTTAAGFLFREAPEEGFMLYIMAFFFALFGLPMALGGLFTAARSLSVRVVAGQVTSLRRWAGVSLWQRQGVLERAAQLELKNAGSMNQGHKHTRYFHVIMRDSSGRRLRLAEGIAGEEAARALRDELIRLLRLA